jgi:hypothetical protein
MKNIFISWVLFHFAVSGIKAQMPDDAFVMNKQELCVVAAYGQSSWTAYWEGKLKRTNDNMGKFTSKMYMPMLGYGISDRLNIYASLPYINNSSDAGTITGKKGWQDAAISAKYQVFGKEKNNWTFTGFATAGFSLPASNYVPDFLPYSIGLGNRAAMIRMILDATYKQHLYVTAQTGYTSRGKIKLDRITYYSDRQYYSNEMAVPDLWDGSLRVGYDHKRLRAEIKYGFSAATSGTDIRKNDMPLPMNKMLMQTIGFHTLLWVPGIHGLGINASYDNVITGRNVGDAQTWMAGLQYIFSTFKSNRHDSNKK